jgi:hypothetical protein
MFNLTINSTNVANSLNNMYQYQFKNGAFEVPAGAEMMITSFQIPYSWYNITSRYNNNSFKIYWPNGAVGNYTAFTLTLEDGFYTVNALNARIQQFCIEKKMYLTDGSGNNVYYISIRIIRIAPCVSDKMHTGALFRVFSKSWFFLRDSQNPTTNLPPKCTWGSFVVVLMHTAALFKRQT